MVNQQRINREGLKLRKELCKYCLEKLANNPNTPIENFCNGCKPKLINRLKRIKELLK